MAVDDYILDLGALGATGLLTGDAARAAEAAGGATLNTMLALGSAPRPADKLDRYSQIARVAALAVIHPAFVAAAPENQPGAA